jgi:predicted amidohydrolase
MTPQRTVRVGLVQFDAVPERVERNVSRMQQLARDAARRGARWVIFHEGTTCDYTANLDRCAEPVPDGPTTQAMAALATELGSYISFGLSERATKADNAEGGPSYFITQVFVGPEAFLYRYRKTWLWREPADYSFRDEWTRYDPGCGPEAFVIDGVRATCFICADGESSRCVERASQLKVDVAFFPNNRCSLPGHDRFGDIARRVGASTLVTNRVGKSWEYDCAGGCTVYSNMGEVLAAANREGEEEILIWDLVLPAATGIASV